MNDNDNKLENVNNSDTPKNTEADNIEKNDITQDTAESKKDLPDGISVAPDDLPEETEPEEEATDITEAPVPSACENTEDENAEESEDINGSEGEETSTEGKKPKRTEKKGKGNPFINFLYDTVEMVAISIGIVILLITFFIRYSPVSGESMTYTINEGDSLLVQIAFYTPKKNDIVILQSPDYDLNKPLIKRVIATGGDTLEINFNSWEVKVNGIVLEEAYVRHNPFEYNPNGDEIPEGVPMSHQDIYNIPQSSFDAETNTFKATVPEGTIFVMGDNRNNSHDSRSSNVGFVDERCVVGKAFFRIYPFSDFGTLD